MSFFNSLKRVFGFGEDVETDITDQNAIDVIEAPKIEGPAASCLEIDSEHVEMIFDQVLSVFNKALPAFLADTVDQQKQRKWLYDSLDNSLKEYLKSMQKAAYQQCEADWMAERDKLQANAEELRKHAQNLEEKKSELKDRQLSADRQKRALAERVKDLEEQVIRLEAEKEQLDIENKCMLNKAKAASVLEAELEALKSNSVEANYQIKSDFNDAMQSEFKKQAAEATQKLKEQEERLIKVQEEFNLKDAQIADLKEKVAQKEAIITKNEATIAEKEAIIAEREEELDNAISSEDLEEIQHQVEKFEEVRQKMDAHIEKLGEALRKAQEENKSLNDALKNSLSDNARQAENHTQEIVELQSQLNNAKKEVDRLSAALLEERNLTPVIEKSAEPDFTVEPSELYSIAEKKKTRKKMRSEDTPLDDIDAIISGSSWMVSAPEEESPMGSKEDSGSFGYQAPQRKRIVNNDSQPSLFDF